VDTASDLDTARVYVSVMAPPEEQADALKGLKAAEGFLKASLRSRIQMRKIPTLSFELDASMERGANLVKLIDQVIESDTAHQERKV
jgi:ribosome-binding factor A